MITRKKNAIQILSQIALVVVLIWMCFTYFYLIKGATAMPFISGYIQILTLIIFATTAIITILNFKTQTEDRNRTLAIQYANLTQSRMSDIDKLFMNNPHLDRLYYQMYSHDPHIKRIVRLKLLDDPELFEKDPSPEALKWEHQACNMIFQKIADVYLCEELSENCNMNNIEWLNVFRSWMKSPILRNHWRYLKYEQHPHVRNFVDRQLIAKNKFKFKFD